MFKKIIFAFSLFFPFFAVAQNLRYSHNDADLYFATQFLKTTFEEKKNNFVVSPLSVYVATALLANGADGNSKIELENILNEPKSSFWDVPQVNMDVLNKNISDYMVQKKDKIKIKNTIVGKNFKPEYLKKVQDELFAKVDSSEAESGKLKLINEVDFKDDWISPFSQNRTTVKDFYSLDGNVDKVDMMYDDERIVDYYQDEKMQAIRLPYKGGNVMHIFLPKEEVNFGDFIQKLYAGSLYLDYRPLPTELSIPKFQFDYDVSDMVSFFKKWGINDIFNDKANLSKLSDVPHFIKTITHKTKIKTDEMGTEAYGMVGEVAVALGFHREPLKPKKWKMIFNANRPFVFMINNGDFIGVYVKGWAESPPKKTPNKEETLNKGTVPSSIGRKSIPFEDLVSYPAPLPVVSE